MIRNTLLFFVFLAFSISKSFAIEWFPKGATWYYETVYWVETHYGYLKIEVVGDTLIQNKQVSILDRTYVSALVSNNTTIYKDIPLYLFFEEGKVYQWINDEFVTVYEFFLPKGASHPVNGYTYEGNPIYAKVDSVWSKTINGRILSAFSIMDTVAVDNEYGCILVEAPSVFEKLGSVYNFFQVITPCGAIDHITDVQSLRCYYDPEIGSVTVKDLQSPGPPLHYATCDTIVPYYRVGVTESLSVLAKIYPNPAEDVLNIFISNEEKLTKAEIFVPDGRIAQTIHRIDSGKIDVSRLQNGVYILLITSEKGTQYYSRFIKK